MACSRLIMAFRDAAKSEEEGKVINAVMMHKTRAFFLSSPVHRDPLKRASKRAKMEWGERDNLQEIVMSNCRKIQLQPTRLPFSPISGPTNPSFISSVSTSRRSSSQRKCCPRRDSTRSAIQKDRVGQRSSRSGGGRPEDNDGCAMGHDHRGHDI